MGPRPFGRGKTFTEARTNLSQISFNGAAAAQSRRVAWLWNHMRRAWRTGSSDGPSPRITSSDWPLGGSATTDGEGSRAISIVLVVFVVLAKVLLRSRIIIVPYIMASLFMQPSKPLTDHN